MASSERNTKMPSLWASRTKTVAALSSKPFLLGRAVGSRPSGKEVGSHANMSGLDRTGGIAPVQKLSRVRTAERDQALQLLHLANCFQSLAAGFLLGAYEARVIAKLPNLALDELLEAFSRGSMLFRQCIGQIPISTYPYQFSS